jgi:hypothetical protein
MLNLILRTSGGEYQRVDQLSDVLMYLVGRLVPAMASKRPRVTVQWFGAFGQSPTIARSKLTTVT